MAAGVAFNEPPDHLIPNLHQSIAHAVATLPPGKSGALVTVVTEAGVNAAVVARVDDVWSVQAWVGKSWGDKSVAVGAQVMAAW